MATMNFNKAFKGESKSAVVASLMRLLSRNASAAAGPC
jgi:hypothetical protein